jgi:hypothetical protein
MALNDIKVPKENAQGTFDEIALAASDLKLGTTANLPIKTGTNGVIEAGSFSNVAGSFCAGDDVRLSDDRDPNLHAASHLPDGADELFDQLLNTDSSVTFDTVYAAAFEAPSSEGNQVLFGSDGIEFLGTAAATTRDNLGLGDAAVEDTTAFAASGSITTSGLTQSTARILGRTTASSGAVEEIQIGSGLSLSAGELSATGGDTVSIESSAADVLSVSSGAISADDAGSDKLVFWDDSAGKLTHLTVGSGLAVTDTTIAVTGGGATNLWIPASAWIPRTTTGCGVDSREIGSTNRQNFDELLFDAGTDEFAQALVIMPSNYNNSTITARFYWTAASGSGDVIWGIQGRAFANDDALDTAHGTAQTATDTLLAADDMHVSAATSAVTIGGTPAANTPIQLQVYRDADAGGDTLAVDARLLGVEIIFN